jgi:membrane-anchored glycerophosphoryl diester phosphodiesterase (GDPDase)
MDNYQAILLIIAAFIVIALGFAVLMVRMSTERIAEKFRKIAKKAGYDVRKK